MPKTLAATPAEMGICSEGFFGWSTAMRCKRQWS